jgi:amidase
VDEAIARAEEANTRLNAVVFSDYERARETARTALPAGPFTGVPFFLKDIMGFAQGMPTRQGSRFIPQIPFDHDSLLTTRFRAAGLIMLGKTNVPEFGLVPTTEGKLYGPCCNPWNHEHSPGARRVARLLSSPLALFRWRMRMMVAVLSAFPPHAAGLSG